MPWLKNHASVRVAAAIVLGGLGLSGCATRQYVDQQIAAVNTRIDGVDSRVQAAQSRADSAAQAAAAAQSRADAANSAAQAAATDARTANQRLDQLTPRVDALENPPKAKGRTPRG
jgi:outer membrane murein-binding lipoprotein Lpp